MTPLRLYLSLCCVLFISNQLDAQFYAGIKGSYAIPFVKSQEIKYDDHLDFLMYKVRFVEQDISPTISGFAYFRNEMIYLQGEVGYRRVKSKFTSINYLNYYDLTPTTQTKETNYIILPISAGVRFHNFKFGCGPVVSIIASENKIFEDLEFFEEKRERTEFGFAFNAGLALNRLHIDISYEFQFEGVGDYFYFRGANNGFSNQTRFVNLGLGYLF